MQRKDSKIIRIPYYLINQCHKKWLLKELSEFYYLKHLYGNSCIFNYSINSLSKKAGYSRTKIRRLIKLFLQKGWCEMHSLNLMFKNPKRFQADKDKKYVSFFGFEYGGTAQSIKENIQYAILRNKQRQCQSAYKVKCDLKNPPDLDSLKKAKKLERKMNLSGESTPDFVIGLYKLAKLFKCSKSNVSLILRNLKVKRFIQIIKQVKVELMSEDMFLQSNYTYYHKGYAFLIQASKFNLLKDLS